MFFKYCFKFYLKFYKVYKEVKQKQICFFASFKSRFDLDPSLKNLEYGSGPELLL